MRPVEGGRPHRLTEMTKVGTEETMVIREEDMLEGERSSHEDAMCVERMATEPENVLTVVTTFFVSVAILKDIMLNNVQ